MNNITVESLFQDKEKNSVYFLYSVILVVLASIPAIIWLATDVKARSSFNIALFIHSSFSLPLLIFQVASLSSDAFGVMGLVLHGFAEVYLVTGLFYPIFWKNPLFVAVLVVFGSIFTFIMVGIEASRAFLIGAIGAPVDFLLFFTYLYISRRSGKEADSLSLLVMGSLAHAIQGAVVLISGSGFPVLFLFHAITFSLNYIYIAGARHEKTLIKFGVRNRWHGIALILLSFIIAIAFSIPSIIRLCLQ